MDGWPNANRPNGLSRILCSFVHSHIHDLPGSPFLRPLTRSYDVSFLGCAWPAPRGAQIEWKRAGTREGGGGRERQRDREAGRQRKSGRAMRGGGWGKGVEG